MSEDLDNFVNELQEQIYEETKDAYGEVAFKRWLEPLYMGQMADPDGYARVTGSCGDTMQMFLKFRDERVKEASFLTDGCGSSTVCGSYAAEMALGKTADQGNDSACPNFPISILRIHCPQRVSVFPLLLDQH